jgi:hypothetical protein
MLLFLLAATLALLVAGVALPKAAVMAPAFWAHLVLALGVMALITAAMQHFVPVLTRGRGAGAWLGRLPWLMAAAGLAVLAVFAGALPWAALPGAAAPGLAGALAMIVWMRGRARHTLGAPHPGLAWYVAAMACLALGLAAAAVLPIFPEAHDALRAFHVHINLYGFVGLTAVGTLQVLMPTAVGRFDPEAGARLKTDLKWACAGAFCLALGRALASDLLGLLGVAAWFWPLGRLAGAWLRLYRAELFAWHGQAPVLLAALLGYAAALLQAGGGMGVANGPLGIFLAGFLFPLVSGAAGQLAPVWAHTGAPTARHEQGRRALARHGGGRALLFLSAALLPLLGYRCAGMPGLTALLWFLGLFVVWLFRDTDGP